MVSALSFVYLSYLGSLMEGSWHQILFW